jgi:signal transduction histidine kinase
MDREREHFISLEEVGELLPENNRPTIQQKIRKNERFEKEERYLHGQLADARRKHDERYELINLTRLGKLYRENGYYDEAIEYYEQALEIDKQNFYALGGDYALNGLYLTYKAMGATPRAVEYFRDRLRAFPKDPIACSQLEAISGEYKSAGNLREAKEILDFLNEIQVESNETTLIAEEESLENEIEQLAQTIQRQEAELLRARQMATLGVMASGLSHEINQPLQIILAVAQNCVLDIQRNAIDVEGIIADLEHIVTTTERIDKIVNHLHVLARERKPTSEVINVNMVIENSFIMFHQQLKSRGIKIERNLSPDLPLVRADIIQLEQVFINLINNARDALEGRANKTITISTQEQNKYIQVRFQDNGKGIAPENLEKVFDAFFTTKQEKGGIGLGLYITQDIIQSFGGTITVDSRVNEGTTFLIKLPITRKENAE